MSVADRSTTEPNPHHAPVRPDEIDVAALTARVHALLPQVRADLERLVAIPSVSAPAFDTGDGESPVERSARAVADLLRGAGLGQVDVLRVTDPTTGRPGRPAVVGHRPGPPGSRTVLLYAHHDVQPPGPEEEWTSPPFEATERGGRLYGRGAADDKAGICVHLAALRALGEELGVGVTAFVEGEEEVGSPSFEAFLEAYRDRLAADVIVVADSGNWRIGVPTLTTSLRGLVDGVVEVRTLDHALHSGMFGGAVPDAITALLRMLATLWDEDGTVAVDGLVGATGADEAQDRQGEELDYPAADLRADAGVLDGVGLIGTGSLTDRLWTRPALTVIGIDAPSVATSSNTLLPVARAKFSLRIPPGQDGAAAFEAIAAHLRRVAPWGARVEVTLGEIGRAWAGDVHGEVYDRARWALSAAWDRPTVQMGVGGSIPFIAALQQVYPDAAVLVTGVEDPDTRAHGVDESLHLDEFARACVAETLLLAALAG